MARTITLAITHLVALAIGFGAGVYLLPILTAEPAPPTEILVEQAAAATYTGELTRDLRGSDALHWGEGTISLTSEAISHQGKLAPGPDYYVYLTRDFVEHEDEFELVKDESVRVGMVRSFDGFILDLPEGIDLEDYTSVVIWCESFGEFITAARYREG